MFANARAMLHDVFSWKMRKLQGHHSIRIDQVYKRFPQRPLRGRWNSVSQAESDIILADGDEFPQVFYESLLRDKKRGTPSKKQSALIAEDVAAEQPVEAASAETLQAT